MQPFFAWKLFETIWFYTPSIAKEQRNTGSCECSEYLGMNKLLLGREYIFVFRLANREVLWCVWSISTAKETMLQVYYLESNREDIELLHKEIQNRHNITLNYHLATSLPKYCWQTCCLMTERDWLQMAPKLWHQVSEILPEIRCMCLGY